MNFFITLQTWIDNQDSNVVKRLNFISFDKFAPKLDDIKKVKEFYPQLSEVIDLFLENTPAIFGGINKFEIKALNASLILVIDDVQTGLKKLSNNPNQIINKVKGINRVVYDISSKPPSTIEWE